MARTNSHRAQDGEGKGTPEGSQGVEAAPYTVVARRYRPQRFEEVVGQDHVVQALRNAIKLDRVAQAYLFSGTRGVGKTSMARIFAKCLNCVHGPTASPCNACDICQAIAEGQDVDVIEIDGASNNGVDSVRELRQNASLRPSRSRYKIYYIDEVHMLSTGAFNALLKTLEEPPSHVKFFFATTEPNKIPITVLSRCQRHDFAGIGPEQIVETLAEICVKEGVEAEREALRAVARRASGSMRDAQSALEQLLSGGTGTLTSALVHQLLGIAGDERVLDLIDALADRDSARALQILDQTVSGGVQPVEVLNGVIEFLRDVMVLSAGADVPLLAAAPAQKPRLEAVAGRWTFDTVLASQQILAEARGRLRGSPHGRLLVELALCRVARLEDLAPVGDLIERLSALEHGAPPAASDGVKKKSVAVAAEPKRLASEHGSPRESKPEPKPEPEPIAVPTTAKTAGGLLSLEEVQQVWPALIEALEPSLASKVRRGRPWALPEPGLVVVAVEESYNWVADSCNEPGIKGPIEVALARLVGRPLAVRFERTGGEVDRPRPTAQSAATNPAFLDDPMVQKLVELFEARQIRVELDD